MHAPEEMTREELIALVADRDSKFAQRDARIAAQDVQIAILSARIALAGALSGVRRIEDQRWGQLGVGAQLKALPLALVCEWRTFYRLLTLLFLLTGTPPG